MLDEKVINYFNGDKMAADVWRDKYCVKDNRGVPQEETPADMHRRLAKEFAKVEFKYIESEFEALQTTTDLGNGNSTIAFYPKYDQLSKFGQELWTKRAGQNLKDIEQEFFKYFDGFRQIVPQGSIMSNLGNNYIFGSLSNCFGIAPPYDSYGGIMKTDEELSHLMKRRGGVGTHLNNLRYSKATVTNAARSSTGVPSFAERYSNTTREVAQEGRRGALMLLLICKHPDIFKFVTMKDDRTKVTGANVSVMFTDEFMQAVEADNNFYCTFPTSARIDIRHKAECSEYNKIYIVDGISIMKIKAMELFDLVAEMAWKNGEPGVAYLDRVVDYSPDGVYEMYIPEVCNPCGEQWFHRDETCRLIATNLFHFVINSFTNNASIDFEKVYEVFYMQQRLGDNLVDLEIEYIDRIIRKLHKDPEPEEIKSTEIRLWNNIRKIAKEGRRTGNGFTALGDMLAALLEQYSSDNALMITEEVMRTKMRAELDATIDMAILRGSFTGWDRDKEFKYVGQYLVGQNSFFQMLSEEFPHQALKMYEYGRRNVSWSTVAPTGTVSLMCQTTSGLEPLFKAFHIRRKKINPSEEGSRVDFVDEIGDCWQEYAVLHPKFRKWIIKQYSVGQLEFSGIAIIDFSNSEPAKIIQFKPEDLPKTAIEELFKKSPWFGSEADDISFEGRVKLQAIIQKYTTNAISSTINLPTDVTQQVVKDIYMSAWKAGLKGVTVYRDGSRSGVLVNESAAKTSKDKFGYTDAMRRPVELDANYYFTTSKGNQYAVVVGLLDGVPYEIFAFENPQIKEEMNGKIIKVASGVYKFVSDRYTIDNLQLPEFTDERILTRWVSMALRHGTNPKFIAEQVEKSDLMVTSFAKVISRILKRYIPDEEVKGELCSECNQPTMIYEEGCKKCINCGNSKC